MGALAIGLSSCMPDLQATSAETGSQPAVAQSADQPSAQAAASLFHVNADEQGRALKGYDPVAYFTTGQAVRGKVEHRFIWNGIEWLFATAEHRSQFAQAPERYAPANGGYCTFGVVLGKKLDGDPEVWSILDGYLYVFLNEEVRDKFLQDQAGNLARVAKNWPQIADKAPEHLE
ncbi:MAG: YHS domain-containing protein [Leptolyngbya sp. SIO4C1]|nr:YHS domain-containing protein [Leptolyngbya sp. SIO4C1]